MEENINKIKPKRLLLKPTALEGLQIGIKINGVKYSVRNDRRRYFFPEEWLLFINSVTNKEHKFFFITALHTGARIMEILNLKYDNINVERGTIKFEIVKQRKAKKEFYAIGKSREFFVASEFIKEYKSFIRGRNINPKDYIFLNNSKLPENYNNLNNEERKKFYVSKTISYSHILKNKLRKVSIKDWWNFSPHNIRKTYGNWMRAFGFEMSEICYRMGHDINTAISNYGSSLIFTDEERRKIQKIMGVVK